MDKPFDASLERVKAVAPVASPVPPPPKAAYLIGPESYGVFKLVAELQKANIPTFRAGAAFDGHPAGTFIVPSTPASQALVEKAAPSLGLVVAAADRMPAVDGFRLKPGTRVGLWKAAGNMPGGWLMWLLEQYGIDHEIVAVAGLHRRPQPEVRRHPAAVGYLEGPHRQRARPQAQRRRRVVVGVRRG